MRYIEMHRGPAGRTGHVSFKGQRSRTRRRSQCMPRRVATYTSPGTPTCEVPSNGVVEISLLPVCTGETSI